MTLPDPVTEPFHQRVRLLARHAQGHQYQPFIRQHVSWIVQILPSIEHQNLYENFDITAGVSALRNTSRAEVPRTDHWHQQPAPGTGSRDVPGFSNFHRSGALHTFADGSTRFLTNTIKPGPVREFGNHADGELLVED